MINEELRWKKGVTEIARRLIQEKLFDDVHFGNNLQTVHTPYSLCKSMISKLNEYCDFTDKKFLVLNLEFVEVLMYDFDVDRSCIWYVTDCEQKKKAAERLERYRINAVCGNFLYMEEEMKFDCVIMNPPYQNQSANKGNTLWDKFVEKSCQIVKEDGFTMAIHPSGWRNSNGTYRSVHECIFAQDLKYLEIHDKPDGQKTFQANTRYDWYIVKNSNYNGITEIVDQDGKEYEIDLRKISFIPNSMIDKILSFVAKNGEETVQIIANSAYHSQARTKDNTISKSKNDKYIYPVIYTTPMTGPTIWYSSTKDNGHFEISKVIFNFSNPIGCVVDKKGEFGMSEFLAGIVGEEEYLDMVAKVIKNQKTNGFADLMEACHFTNKVFNKEIFCLFRKNFWEEFI